MTRDRLIRALHRRRNRRPRAVRVLDQNELAERLGVPVEAVVTRMAELGWPFHQDGAGRVWATEREEPDAET